MISIDLCAKSQTGCKKGIQSDEIHAVYLKGGCMPVKIGAVESGVTLVFDYDGNHVTATDVLAMLYTLTIPVTDAEAAHLHALDAAARLENEKSGVSPSAIDSRIRTAVHSGNNK